MTLIRRATIDDALGIHNARRESILKLCSADYTPEQIEAWGNKPFDAEFRIHCIQNDFIWVVECDHRIEGYLHMTAMKKKERVYVDLSGLYVTPKIKGQGLGKALLLEAEKHAQLLGIDCIRLGSTLTSVCFYEKMLYKKLNDVQTRLIRHVAIPYLPMEKKLSPFNTVNT